VPKLVKFDGMLIVKRCWTLRPWSYWANIGEEAKITPSGPLVSISAGYALAILTERLST